MPVRLVISISHPLLLVSCNDRCGVAYATTLTQALLQVLASYSMQRFFQPPPLNSHSHALNSHSHLMADLTPIPVRSHGTHGILVFPIPVHTSSISTLQEDVTPDTSGSSIPPYTCTATFDFEDNNAEPTELALNVVTWPCTSDEIVLWCTYLLNCWWRSTVVERRSLTGELSLSCARPAADG